MRPWSEYPQRWGDPEPPVIHPVCNVYPVSTSPEVNVTTQFKPYFYTVSFSEWLGFCGRHYRLGQQRRWAIWHFRFGYYRKFPVYGADAI